MSTQAPRNVAYGLSDPLLNVAQAPIIAQRDPTTKDRAQLGTEWINQQTDNIWFLVKVEDNISTWIQVGGSGGTITFDADFGSAVPSGGILTLTGAGDVMTSATGSTVTFTGSGIETVHTGSGDVTASGNAITITGGNNISTTGSLSTVTVNVSGTSNHQLQVGNSSGSLTSLGLATNGQLPIGSTGLNPVLATLTAGAGISITNGAGSISIAAMGSVPLTFDADSGSAVPSANTITFSGGTGIATSATGSTVTITATGGTTTFDGDTGTATPSSGIITMHGGNNITTSATGSTVTYNVSGTTNHALQLGNATGSLTSLAVATNGQLPIGSTGANPVLATITAGTGINVTNGAGSITVAALGTVPLSFATGSGTATPSGNTITIAGGTGITTSGSGSTVTITASGGSGIVTIDGNTGSVTGSTVTIASDEGTLSFGSSGTTLFLQSSDGNDNTGIGQNALVSLTSGTNNTAVGRGAGDSVTSGIQNCFFGDSAGSTASTPALTGSQNNGYGANAFGALTSGNHNNAVGFNGLNQLTTGTYNAVLGSGSGVNYTTSESHNVLINNGGTLGESNVLRIGAATGTGTQNLNSAFICGITGIVVTGSPILISTGNQLGVASSSQRFKSNIKDMGSASDVLYSLRPVTFNWNKQSAPGLKDASDLTQYGLIAEEAIKYVPQAVNVDSDGNPININYQDLIGLLINEVQRLNKRVQSLEKRG